MKKNTKFSGSMGLSQVDEYNEDRKGVFKNGGEQRVKPISAKMAKNKDRNALDNGIAEELARQVAILEQHTKIRKKMAKNLLGTSMEYAELPVNQKLSKEEKEDRIQAFINRMPVDEPEHKKLMLGESLENKKDTHPTMEVKISSSSQILARTKENIKNSIENLIQPFNTPLPTRPSSFKLLESYAKGDINAEDVVNFSKKWGIEFTVDDLSVLSKELIIELLKNKTNVH